MEFSFENDPRVDIGSFQSTWLFCHQIPFPRNIATWRDLSGPRQSSRDDASPLIPISASFKLLTTQEPLLSLLKCRGKTQIQIFVETLGPCCRVCVACFPPLIPADDRRTLARCLLRDAALSTPCVSSKEEAGNRYVCIKIIEFVNIMNIGKFVELIQLSQIKCS